MNIKPIHDYDNSPGCRIAATVALAALAVLGYAWLLGVLR